LNDRKLLDEDGTIRIDGRIRDRLRPTRQFCRWHPSNLDEPFDQNYRTIKPNMEKKTPLNVPLGVPVPLMRVEVVRKTSRSIATK
jgi:hypothetical protein